MDMYKIIKKLKSDKPCPAMITYAEACAAYSKACVVFSKSYIVYLKAAIVYNKTKTTSEKK